MSTQPVDSGGRARLSGAVQMPAVRRSVILETCVRLAFHTVLVFGVYLLFAGHNQPGGGFIGGLVAGSAFVLRYVAGGRAELRTAVPIDPGLLLGAGVLLATTTGMGAWVFGVDFLTSTYGTAAVPLLGEVKASTVLLFDFGVFLVVIGLVLTLLRTLGAEAER
jgi:multicomponent Na+:H+ antiporter subunit A